MFTVKISRNYKYSYIVYRNNRQVARFNTKKQARDYLFEIHSRYRILNRDTPDWYFTPTLLQGGNRLVVYHANRPSFANPEVIEFKDNFTIQQQLNN